MRRRLVRLVQPPVENFIGATCLLLSVVLMLLIPLGNILPALSVCLFSFAVLERDGVWTIVGAVLSLVSLVIVGAAVYAVVAAAMLFLGTIFA